MPNLTIIGAQWGDEGKGKIVDWLSDRADVVVRFQGGHNAGHTLVIGGEVVKLSLLPSGIMRSEKLCIIGNGVVLNPWALLEEIRMVTGKGVSISPENLIISENTTLILPAHEELDKARERNAGRDKIGTTGRGIGPAYEDKVGRRSIRLSDIFCDEILDRRLKSFSAHHNLVRTSLGMAEINSKSLKLSLIKVGELLKDYVAPAWKILNERSKSGSSILFEGAQGSLLDVDFGTYPYVTSSNTLSGMASLGSGIPVSKLGTALGIVKAYTTRVGEGPFPTEIFDKIGSHLALTGKEKGTVTGRDRRCGWFDSILVKQTGILNGFAGLALTKLDVLDGLEEIKICKGYMIDGELHDFLPIGIDRQNMITPVYETLPGWTQSTYGKKRIEDLPKNALSYINRIEELTEIPISLISTSPERDDIILFKDPYGCKDVT